MYRNVGKIKTSVYNKNSLTFYTLSLEAGDGSDVSIKMGRMELRRKISSMWNNSYLISVFHCNNRKLDDNQVEQYAHSDVVRTYICFGKMND